MNGSDGTRVPGPHCGSVGFFFLHFQSLRPFKRKSVKGDVIIFASVCLDTMDFSSMTLTQIKRQEMDAQVRTELLRANQQFYLHICLFKFNPN